MAKERWFPCFCTMILGALVIVFAWWHVAWGQTALTVVGGLIILKGLINRCCCEKMGCCRSETPKTT